MNTTEALKWLPTMSKVLLAALDAAGSTEESREAFVVQCRRRGVDKTDVENVVDRMKPLAG